MHNGYNNCYSNHFNKIVFCIYQCDARVGGGGGGGGAYVGHLTAIAFPTLGNLTKNMGARVGTFAFFAQEMGPSHIVPCAHLCPCHLGSACVEIESILKWTFTSCK